MRRIPTKEEDRLAVIWALRTLKWSWRRISRIQLPKSHHTIKALYEMACKGNELPDSAKLPIFAKDEKKLRTLGVDNIEYFDGEINHNECGGGKRSRAHKYDSDFKLNSRDV